MRTLTKPVLLAALAPVVAVLPALLLVAATGERQPDPMPVHFGFSGVADGFAARWAVALGLLVLGGFLAVLFGAGGRAHADQVDGRRLVATSWATAGFLGTVQFGCAAAALDRSDAVGAVLPGWTFPVAIVAAAVAGFAGHRLAPEGIPAEEPAPAAPLPVGRTEQVSWSRTASSPLILTIAGVLGLFGIAASVIGGPIEMAVGGLLLGAVVATTGSARVTVDRRGLTVALGLLGRPRIRVPATDVASVSTTTVVPTTLGGWGYRVVPGGRALVLRAGPAIVVTRRSGRTLTVTVDDPDTAAGLLAGISRC